VVFESDLKPSPPAASFFRSSALHPRFPTSIPLALLFLRCSPPFVHERGIRGPGLGLGRLFDRGAHDQYACGEFQRRGTIAPAQKDILSAILYLLPASDARTLVPLKGLYPWRRCHRSRSLPTCRPSNKPRSQWRMPPSPSGFSCTNPRRSRGHLLRRLVTAHIS
jgi:hypothetical protein